MGGLPTGRLLPAAFGRLSRRPYIRFLFRESDDSTEGGCVHSLLKYYTNLPSLTTNCI